MCLGYATSHETVVDVDKQRGYETLIVPEFMHDKNSVLMVLYVILTYCMAAHTIAMATVLYITKTWMQKKVFLL